MARYAGGRQITRQNPKSQCTTDALRAEKMKLRRCAARQTWLPKADSRCAGADIEGIRCAVRNSEIAHECVG